MIFLLIFGGVGLLFFVLGLIFLIMEFRKKFRNDKLLKSGNYVMAEISEVELNYNVTVNMRHPLKQNFVKKFQKTSCTIENHHVYYQVLWHDSCEA